MSLPRLHAGSHGPLRPCRSAAVRHRRFDVYCPCAPEAVREGRAV